MASEEAAPAKRILVVEDNDVSREGTVVVLRGAGYTVDAASNGREALLRMKAGVLPDLILLDMMMPEQDGWDFLRERRGDPAFAAVPVVITTGLGIAGLDWALALGAAGLIRKPIETDELLKEVARRC
jgi:CheY-like chemotaxis protein